MSSPLPASVIPTLMRDEGFSATPYRDTEGVLTIGYGINLDQGLTDDEAMFLLESRVNAAVYDCRRTFSWFLELDLVRQGVLVMLRYQLGLPRLLGFAKMLAALAAHDYERAAAELLDSKLARQAPARTKRHAEKLRTGKAGR